MYVHVLISSFISLICKDFSSFVFNRFMTSLYQRCYHNPFENWVRLLNR